VAPWLYRPGRLRRRGAEGVDEAAWAVSGKEAKKKEVEEVLDLFRGGVNFRLV
jgi:hypothetical protein